ncbi:beta-lactamase family protein [Aestuariibacter halophilus]|uniref:Beta-lactamase family protein n=1 Tax=Fluctibacter halophilus TaxID=226011 RepID=A0ABS8G6S2_9ALTE|nr:serine hydrolase [Aestuariibacter halophilus]MCC2615791.1 beta-lactamase family protein [Aestuariibacter halophilus]
MPVNTTPQSDAFSHLTPQQAGIDPTALQTAFDSAQTLTALRSLLVLKDGALVAEAYYNGQSAASLHHVRSVTKTVAALVVGIALEKGVIDSLDVTVGEVLWQAYPDMSAEVAGIRILDLLTMRSGFTWDEDDGSLFVTWSQSQDPVNFLLSRPLAETPGTTFNYNSAAVHLLWVMLDTLMNGNIDAFVQQHLFEPLAIDHVAWERLADGRVNGSAGLQLRAADIAKLGVLLAAKGTINITGQPRRIVSEAWIQQMAQSHVSFSGPSGNYGIDGYGYLWWLSNQRENPHQVAAGWGGQYIFTRSEGQWVIVATNRYDVSASQAQQQSDATGKTVMNGIVAAIEDP